MTSDSCQALPIASWTVAERQTTLVIAIARSKVGLPPVVIALV
jgi:hypothetical protein